MDNQIEHNSKMLEKQRPKWAVAAKMVAMLIDASSPSVAKGPTIDCLIERTEQLHRSVRASNIVYLCTGKAVELATKAPPKSPPV